MKLFIELFVPDLERSRTFYVDVFGMKVVKETSNFIELIRGEVQVNLCALDMISKGHFLSATTDSKLGSRVEFCFEVEDIQEIHDRVIKAGVKILEPIKKMPWDRTDFRIADPDGAYWRITTPVVHSQI